MQSRLHGSSFVYMILAYASAADIESYKGCALHRPGQTSLEEQAYNACSCSQVKELTLAMLSLGHTCGLIQQVPLANVLPVTPSHLWLPEMP